jgi:uncharacterized protein DUF6335
MARKKPAKKAKKQAKKKMAPARKAGKKKAAKKSAAKRSAAKKAARKSTKRSAKPARKMAAKAPSSAKATAGKPVKKPNLDRPRKTVADVHGIPSSLAAAGASTAASSGRQEMKDKLRKHTGSGPALTSGDVDADWESAESVGDEAPGGDNPTPDQDVVDDIGRALGVEYEDDEELQGGAEIKERDRHRWELDPASKDEDEED